MEFTTAIVLQVLISLGILNVWLLRANSTTPYRGGLAKTLKAEFSEYGLPSWFFFVVGGLKLTAAVCLVLGIFYPALVLPSALTVMALMAGALGMHARVKDPLDRYLPAAIMFVMSGTLSYLAMG